MFTKFNLIRRLLTLFVPILLHHVRYGWSSSSFPILSLLMLGTDCLSFPLSGGPGPPLPPSSTLTPFPSDPRQQPVSTSGTLLVLHHTSHVLRWPASTLTWFMLKKVLILNRQSAALIVALIIEVMGLFEWNIIIRVIYGGQFWFVERNLFQLSNLMNNLFNETL